MKSRILLVILIFGISEVFAATIQDKGTCSNYPVGEWNVFNKFQIGQCENLGRIDKTEVFQNNDVLFCEAVENPLTVVGQRVDYLQSICTKSPTSEPGTNLSGNETNSSQHNTANIAKAQSDGGSNCKQDGGKRVRIILDKIEHSLGNVGGFHLQFHLILIIITAILIKKLF